MRLPLRGTSAEYPTPTNREGVLLRAWKAGEGGSPIVGATGLLLLISGVKARSYAKECEGTLPRISEQVILLAAQIKYDLDMLVQAVAYELEMGGEQCKGFFCGGRRC